MNTKWSGVITLAIFLFITIVVFLLLVSVLPGLWCSLSGEDSCTGSLASIESLSTALAAAVVFGAGFIAYRELSEVANSRYMEIADRLFEELNSPENIEARRRVFQDLPADPEKGLRKMSAKNRDAMKKVLNSLDHVAFLTQSGWIPDELVMPWMHPMIAKSWEKLEPYVLYERQRRNEPYYYQYVAKLAERCRKWRLANLSDTTTKWIDNAL
ncbi:MAG: DUF4760 domain-containing protein [Anaerolineales bacterium]